MLQQKVEYTHVIQIHLVIHLLSYQADLYYFHICICVLRIEKEEKKLYRLAYNRIQSQQIAKKKKKPFKTIAFFPQSVARHNHKGQFTKVFDVFMEVNLSYSNRIINNVFCRLFRSLSIALSLFPLCNSYSSTEKQKKKILVVMLISQLQHFCCLAILLYLYARFP